MQNQDPKNIAAHEGLTSKQRCEGISMTIEENKGRTRGRRLTRVRKRRARGRQGGGKAEG